MARNAMTAPGPRMLRSIGTKTIRDQRRALLGWAIGIVAIVLMYASVYPNIRQNAAQLRNYVENLPEAFKAVIGESTDFTTPTGYLRTEVFSIMAPLLFLIYAIGSGARATAGEEEAGTLDLLLSTPLRRRRVLAEKYVAMLAGLALLGVVLFASIALLGPAFDLVVGLPELASASLTCVLLALAFGSVSLALGCALGRRGLALGITSTIAVATYVVNVIAPTVESIESLRYLSPFFYYLEPGPLEHGIDVGYAAVLAGISAVAYVVAHLSFERRDLTV